MLGQAADGGEAEVIAAVGTVEVHAGLASFAVALVIGTYGTFWLGWELVANVVAVVPASVAVFFLSRFLGGDDPATVERRGRLFAELDRPVDTARELAGIPDRTSEVFRFLSRSTAAVGVLSLLLLGYAAPGERATVIGYALLTLALAAGLAFVRGATPLSAAPPASPTVSGA